MNRKCNGAYGKSGDCPEAAADRNCWQSEEDCPSWWKPSGQYRNGDVYLNPAFGDLWIVDGKLFVKINDGYTIDVDEPNGFIKVGYINGVINKKMKG